MCVHIFSSWSFAVVMWEIETGGKLVLLFPPITVKHLHGANVVLDFIKKEHARNKKQNIEKALRTDLS